MPYFPREIDPLRGYPTSGASRKIAPGQRGIQERIVASRRDHDFFDGNRDYGYGGFTYDGRWRGIAQTFADDFDLATESEILQIQCEKGFLLHDFLDQDLVGTVVGTETSEYAIKHAFGSAVGAIVKSQPESLPFADRQFDLVIALGVVYTLTLGDAIATLREIARVSSKGSFVTLATYDDDDDLEAMREWSLLGNLILARDDWCAVMKEANYEGSYGWVTAKKLKVFLSR